MNPLANVLDLFPNELSRLGAWRLSFFLVAPGAFDRPFVRHDALLSDAPLRCLIQEAP
jgi:hypothetical protein